MSCPRVKCLPRQRGAALVVAMLVFALVAALMVGLQRDFTLILQRGTHQVFTEQTWAYLIGAEGLAQLALQADSRADARAEQPSDHLGELWAQPPNPYPLDGGGWMQGGIEDLQGRFNLNLLTGSSGGGAGANGEGGANAPDGDSGDAAPDSDSDDIDSPSAINGTEERWSPAQKVLIRLLQALGDASLPLEEAMALTDAITDFIDADSQRRERGAEESEYRYADFPYLPANRSLASVSELRAVQGMTVPVYEALAPLVTVWPETGAKLNVLTCPLPVLRALNADDQMAPLAQTEAERIDALRREAVLISVEDFMADPALEGRPLGELESLLDTRSDWFVLDATVELADRERHLFTVLRRSSEQVLAVFRSEGEL